MNLKIERFRKFSKLVGLVIKAASILLWLSVLSGMIGLLYCAVSSEEDFGVFPAGEGTVYYGLKNSSTRYGPLPAPLPDEFSVRGETLSAIVVSTSINGLAAYSIHCLVKIFQDAAGEEYTPFSIPTAKRLKRMGISTALIAPVFNITNSYALSMMYGVPFQLENTLGGSPRGYFYLLLPLMGLALYGVGLIFEYGIELQLQADETL